MGEMNIVAITIFGLLLFALVCLIVYFVSSKMEKLVSGDPDREIEIAQQDRVMKEKEAEKQKEEPALLYEEPNDTTERKRDPDQVYCPHCGKFIGYGDRDFCPYCGKNLIDKML